jgi:hypothetical protein
MAFMKKTTLQPQPATLDERLKALKQEMEDHIESRVTVELERLRAQGGGLPRPVLRLAMCGKSACACAEYENVRRVEKEDAAIEARQSGSTAG